MYWFKRKYRQVKRVIDFLPLIWNGFDFDYIYAVKLFRKQLERLADELESDRANTISAPINAQKIRTAIRLMDKVYDDYYSLQHHDILEKMYGKHKFDFVETGELDSKGNPYYTMKSTWEFAVDENHNEEIERVSREMSKVGNEKQKRAHKLLWDYIEHNITRWWD